MGGLSMAGELHYNTPGHWQYAGLVIGPGRDFPITYAFYTWGTYSWRVTCYPTGLPALAKYSYGTVTVSPQSTPTPSTAPTASPTPIAAPTAASSPT
jgi:hypothetical protein